MRLPIFNFRFPIEQPIVGRRNLLLAEQTAKGLRVRRVVFAYSDVKEHSAFSYQQSAVGCAQRALLPSPVGYLFCARKTVTWRWGQCGKPRLGREKKAFIFPPNFRE